MISAVREASTGALTLMEGLHLGKASLVSDSPYQGAKDYLKGFGYYFKHDDFNDLVRQMKKLWKRRPTVKVEVARNYIQKQLTYDKMAKDIHKLCKKVLKKRSI
jgi:glycosyltransferase involved in cell wall biosynthesis